MITHKKRRKLLKLLCINTLIVTKVFPTRWWCTKGGVVSMGPPLRKHFPAEFCDEYYTIYMYTKKNHIQAKKVPKKSLQFQNSCQMTDFRFATFRFQRKFEKKTLSQKNFKKIWPTDHEYINIAEIKIDNVYSGGILGAKCLFPHPPKC